MEKQIGRFENAMSALCQKQTHALQNFDNGTHHHGTHVHWRSRPNINSGHWQYSVLRGAKAA
jgi:hypothetical protein